MEEQLKRLAEYQSVQRAALRLDEEIRRTPELIEAAGRRLQQAEEQIASLKQQQQEAQKERRRLAGEMDLLQQRVSDFKSKLNDSKQIRTNEQYRAMLRQIETAEEDSYRHLERQYAGEELERRIAAELKRLEGECRVVRTEVEEERRRLEEERARQEKERSSLLERGALLEGGLDGPLLAVFRRVAAARGGLGLALVRDGICLACRVRLRPQVYVEVRLNSQIWQCENCMRLLYWPHEEGQTAAPLESLRSVEPEEEPA